jgi:hypothetical protein
VPFMNNTTGADPTALSMAALVSAERKRAEMGKNRGGENLDANVGAGRVAWRNASRGLVLVLLWGNKESINHTEDNSGLETIFVVTIMSCDGCEKDSMMSRRQSGWPIIRAPF